MENEKKKILSFTDLDAWNESHNLVLMIYEETNKFPKEEMFGLSMQLKRAGVSVSSNIAEGFSRQTYKDKMHFYVMSLGSLTEIQNLLLVARDVKILLTIDFQPLAEQTIKVSKILNGLIKSSKFIIHNS